MANERFMQLINELHQATLDGRVRWAETAKEGVFRVGLGDGLVRIQTASDDEDNYCVMAVLLNSQGRVVDDLVVWGNDENYSLLRELYDKARSSALHIDEVVDSCFRILRPARFENSPWRLSPRTFRFDCGPVITGAHFTEVAHVAPSCNDLR